MQTLCSKVQHHYVTFHNCAHGGERDKSTSLWVNDDSLDELALLCDRKHKHKPWTSTLHSGKVKFATSGEAAYPLLLCECIVNCIKRIALEMGAHAPDTLAEQAEGPTKDRLSRLVLGALPRGQKVKPLVNEFGSYLTVFADPQQPALWTLSCFSSQKAPELCRAGCLKGVIFRLLHHMMTGMFWVMLEVVKFWRKYT